MLAVLAIVSFSVWYLLTVKTSFTTIIILSWKVWFSCILDRPFHPIVSADTAKAVNARRVENLEEFVSQCDIITVNCPLHEGTRGLINADLLRHFKKGAYLVNTARGAICNKEDVAAALKSGHLNGKCSVAAGVHV